MTDKTSRILSSIALAGIMLLSLFTYSSSPSELPINSSRLGAIGNLLAENYIPYIQYNEGYNSAKDLTITGSTVLASTTITSFKHGQLGTPLTQLLKGSCNLIGTGGTFAASSTLAFDCAVTGVLVGDTVLVTASSTPLSASLSGGWVITGASASSTAGFIRFSVVNFSGGTATVPLSIASGTQYIVAR